jgi:ribonuclease P protein component
VKFSKGSRRNGAHHFASNRGPTVPPKRDYAPTRSAHKPPFHAEIEAASQLEEGSPEFHAFVRDIVNMPPEMAPSVAAAIRQQKWKIAPNPLAVIRTGAHQESKRSGPGSV